MKRFNYVQMVQNLASILIVAAVFGGSLGQAETNQLDSPYQELSRDSGRRVNGGWLPKATRHERPRQEREDSSPVRGERTEAQDRLWGSYDGRIGPRRETVNVYAGLAESETAGSSGQNQKAQGSIATSELPFVEKNGHLESNIVVMFSATWCGPCKRMYPLMTQLRKEGYIVYVYTLDTADYVDLDLQSKFQIRAYPTFLIFDKGIEVIREVGVTNVDWFRKNLKTKTEQDAEPSDDPYDGI